MPIDNNMLAQSLKMDVSATVDVSSIINTIVNQHNRAEDRNVDNSRRGSLVASCASKLFHEIAKAQPNEKRGIVIFVSTLPHEKAYRDGGWIGSGEIAGWGYEFYAIYWGWIKNNGDRGFHNWCVYGYQRQNDNVINIDQ